jgi:hypothetical protein
MRKVLSIAIALLIPAMTLAWGPKGHDTVAYIAEKHLSKKTLKKVTEVLEGKSLVYVANWLDNASHTDRYRYTKTWHYANVDEGYTYETMPKNEKGDVVEAINGLVAELKSGKLSREQEDVRLRMYPRRDLH